MSNTMKLFTMILIVQLFYGFAVTTMAYAVPDDAKTYVTSFSEVDSNLDLETIGTDVEESLESQTNIPVIDIGALVFYSGNILIDLLLNFVLAIPSMITLLINGLMMLINADGYLVLQLQTFAGVLITVLYFIGIIQLLTNVRSGRAV
jgi:hypothetical protein